MHKMPTKAMNIADRYSIALQINSPILDLMVKQCFTYPIATNHPGRTPTK